MVVNIFNFSAQEAAAGGSREFEASLVYISSSRENLSQKKKKKVALVMVSLTAVKP